MTQAKLEAAAGAMRARNAAKRKPMEVVRSTGNVQRVLSRFNGQFDLLKEGLDTLAEVGMPYHTVMTEVAKLYVRSAVKIHGSYTRAAVAVHAHRNTLHRVERER